MITLGGYQACVFDLVCDPDTKRLSATKIWLHVGNIILCKVMLSQQTVGWELLLAFGAVVSGSHVATYWLKRKYAAEPDSSLPEK